MVKAKKQKTIRVNKDLIYAFGVFLIILGLGIFNLLLNYFQLLRNAHSTFENYYAFRGCTLLLQKTDTYGTCKLADGKVIKIVKFNNRWYLDGDLPVCISGICF